MEPLQPDDPRRVDRYELIARLGAGGMGRVFYGRSPGGRPVAVKVVHPEYGADAGFRLRFAREVEAARRVGGFHTAQVVDADPRADPPWLVTAYVDGPSLQTVVGEQGPLPADRVRALGAALVEGLIAIHGCGLVHRDLKPGNVIMGADGPRVIDFGVARALDATAVTDTGAIVGTPAYMSPEQALGKEAGPASDVFSLGAVLAYAATGTVPFGRGALAAVVYRVVNEDPDLGGVPEELRGIVGRCLAKDPGERPDLRELLSLLVGEPPPDGAPPDADLRAEGETAELAGSGGAEFRVSTVRDLLHFTSLVILVPPLILPALVLVFLAAGEHVPVPVWLTAGFSAALFAVLVLGLLISERLVVDRTGITRRVGGGSETGYPWEEIERVAVHRWGARGSRWRGTEYLAVVPKEGSRLPRKGNSMGWQSHLGHYKVINLMTMRGEPYDELGAAVARFSDGRIELERTERAEEPPPPPVEVPW
ncbi:serine/threonine-protein kinase [Actinomadura viridis]|uniref:serine/threonine-protein kinase n=1 Tax=Actinomadura viridis TaxID=58110 RepID=UPI00368E1515